MVENFTSFILISEKTMHLSSYYIKNLISILTLLFSYFSKLLHSKRYNNATTSDDVKPSISCCVYDELKPIIISANEVNMVMKRLGFRDKGFEENEEKIVEEDKFHSLFVEEEPSLEEIWETFNVFDENKDGFIDGLELGRVLCSLGFLKEGLDVERCKKMINCFDRNKDGLLDFIDFLEFMQISLR